MNSQFANHEIFRSAVATLATTPFPDDLLCDGCMHARAHNFLHDERIGDERAGVYLRHLKLDNPSPAHVRERHAAYVDERVRTAGIPDTFLAINQDAHLDGLDGDQILVRMENLDLLLNWTTSEGYAASESEAFDKLGRFHAQLTNNPHGSTEHNDAKAFFEDAMDYWNIVLRDTRPVFVAFEADVLQEIAVSGWPEALRTRLGLAHFVPKSPKKQIYVALMRYSVKDVLHACHKVVPHARAFAVPTALDQYICEYFFPAPMNPRTSTSYGRSMALKPVEDTRLLLAELLHVKINYQPGHFSKFGRLTGSIPDYSVRDLRNAHLEALRIDTERDDFGEWIPAPGKP
ncbi:MAG: hypothetical protein H7833_04100 [Magnetococcus sp. DMHC-1]|nr:hypothetical protein [Magnetococcales bacterium]